MTRKAKPRRSGSRHKKRSMLSLPQQLYDRLAALAAKNKRPVTWEGRLIIEEAVDKAGIPPGNSPK